MTPEYIAGMLALIVGVIVFLRFGSLLIANLTTARVFRPFCRIGFHSCAVSRSYSRAGATWKVCRRPGCHYQSWRKG